MNEKKPSVFSRNVIRVGTIGAFLPKRLKLFLAASVSRANQIQCLVRRAASANLAHFPVNFV